jgi:hypothetical protein
MKLSFGLLFMLLNTPSLATSFSASTPVGGTCFSDIAVPGICGATPEGVAQYEMLKKDVDCEALLDCIFNDGEIPEVVSCIYDFIYCTANIDNARAQGYRCYSEVFDICFEALGYPDRSEEEAAKASELIEDIHSSLPMNGGGTTMLSSGPISSQVATEECVSVRCGTAPDGARQIYMMDPADCVFYYQNACFNRCFFCAEEAEIDQTRFSTSYECLGGNTTRDRPIPVCEAYL